MMSRKVLIIIASWAFLVLGIFYIYFVPVTVPVPIERSFIYFPFEIDGWEGEEVVPPEKFIPLGADEVLRREYHNASGEKVHLYITYFSYVDESRNTPSLRSIWQEGGWHLKDLGVGETMLDISGISPVITGEMIAEKGDKKMLIFYSYRINGKYVVSRGEFKFLTALDSVFKRHTGTFTLEVYSEAGGESLNAEREALKGFLSKVLSILEEDFLP